EHRGNLCEKIPNQRRIIAKIAAGSALTYMANGIKRIFVRTKAPNFSDLDKDNVGTVIEEYLRTSKGVFGKIGQMSSYGHSKLAELTRARLGSLHSIFFPFAPWVVQVVLDTAYGPKFSQIFKNFSFKPIAADSIGHVHRATLQNGTEVAVK